MTKLDDLIEQARRLPPMTPEQREEQRRSFAHGNTAIENPRITREMIDRIADETPASQEGKSLYKGSGQ